MPSARRRSRSVSATTSVPSSPNLRDASNVASEMQQSEKIKDLYKTIQLLSHRVNNNREHFDDEIVRVKNESVELHRQIKKQASEIEELKLRLKQANSACTITHDNTSTNAANH